MSSMHAFTARKESLLSKRDRSSRGRIDPHVVSTCSLLNLREEYCTLSSCSGRFYMYKGIGNKSGNNDSKKKDNRESGDLFDRFRICHEHLPSSPSAVRYFDLQTLLSDPTGGGDEIPDIAQYDYIDGAAGDAEEGEQETPGGDPLPPPPAPSDQTIWLRYEPLILHIQTRSLLSADALLTASRAAGLKTCGLQSSCADKIIVFIIGEEGLEMPLTSPHGTPLFTFPDASDFLMKLVNDRQQRNWSKIERFNAALRALPDTIDNGFDSLTAQSSRTFTDAATMPKHFDVIGDVALLHSLPDGADPEEVGLAVLNSNKNIKVVALQTASLQTSSKSLQSGLMAIAGNVARLQTSPPSLLTTHTEHTIKCVVDLAGAFFTPRMGPERLRLCNCVARGEKVLVMFAGVGMEGLMIAGRREIAEICMVEMNPCAVACIRKGKLLLKSNKAVAGGKNRSDLVEVVEGDVGEVVPKLKKNWYDRVICPRPKEGKEDGDLGEGVAGGEFLKLMLPHMKQQGGECHWYDFAADWELEGGLVRTKGGIETVCREEGYEVEFSHAGKAGSGSVAKRQFRVCVDFKVHKVEG